MSAEHDKRIEIIFHAALERSIDERSEFLTEACAGDSHLRDRVEALLEADDRVDAVMGSAPKTALGHVAGEESADALVGSRFGRYVVRERVGEGGMGVVYRAEQDNPHRTVALKLIKPGYATPGMLRRFEFEAETLGRLQHPGIAQIFEAGTHDHGGQSHAYFVMEFIEGRPLLAYADSINLGTRERVSLFTQICDAVHHAHQKGVIHRDLKPDNILVCEAGRDETDSTRDSSSIGFAGQPKILDFGVARATASDVQLTTMQTDVGQLVGTIPYMSPEQVSGNPDDLDTRSDVYGLGVNLYQLLTDRLPYELRGKSIPEAMRIIGEEDPTPLSSINRVFRGDLETVVGKALEKDKARRYGSAAELASDLRFYLQDQPVSARPASFPYQLRKFARRNRALVSGLITTVAALLIGLVVSISQFTRARAAEAVAHDERTEAVAQSARAAVVNDFLLDMLASIKPEQALGRDTAILRELLGEAAREVREEFADQPEVRLSLHDAIGSAYHGIGQYGEAIPHFREALELRMNSLGAGNAEVAKSQVALAATLHQHRGYDQEATTLLQAGLETQRQVLDPNDSSIAITLTHLAMIEQLQARYDTALAMLHEALRILEQSSELDLVLLGNVHFRLSDAYTEAGEFTQAEQHARESLAFRQQAHGQDNLLTSGSLHAVGVALRAQGRHQEAETFLVDALAMRRSLLGNHNYVAEVLDSLGQLYRTMGKLKPAENLFRESVEMRRRLFPETHREVGLSVTRLGNLLRETEQFDESEALLREAVDIMSGMDLDPNPELGNACSNLASLLKRRGRYAEAEAFGRKALEIGRSVYGGPHHELATLIQSLGQTLVRMAEYDEAESLLKEAVEMHRLFYGEKHPHTAQSWSSLAGVHMRRRAYKAAEPLEEKALAIRRELFPGNNAAVSESLNNMAVVLKNTGRVDQAKILYREALAMNRALYGNEHSSVSLILFNLAVMLDGQGNAGEAEPLYREALAIQRQVLGEDHPNLTFTTYKLGTLLRKRGELKEAEELLRLTLEIRQARYAANHPRVISALQAYGRVLAAMKDAEGAESQFRKLLAILQENRPAGHGTILSTQISISDCLVMQKRFKEAEQLLLATFKTSTETRGPDHKTTLGLRKRLVRLYEAWGRPEEAVAWRATN